MLSPTPKLASEIIRFQRRELVGVVGHAARHALDRRSRCMGANVRLKKTNVVQKWILPSVSSYIRPVIFGNQ